MSTILLLGSVKNGDMGELTEVLGDTGDSIGEKVLGEPVLGVPATSSLGEEVWAGAAAEPELDEERSIPGATATATGQW